MKYVVLSEPSLDYYCQETLIDFETCDGQQLRLQQQQQTVLKHFKILSFES